MQFSTLLAGNAVAILRCPVCYAGLVSTEIEFACRGCGRLFSFENGIAVLHSDVEHTADLQEMSRMVGEMESKENTFATRELFFRLPHRPHSFALQMSERKSMASVIEHISALPNPKILNVSCGLGREGQLLLDAGIQELHLMDISKPAVRYAKRQFMRFYPDRRLFFTVGDALHMPFKNDAFDVVFVYSSAHHYADVIQFLVEGLRVAREVILCAEPAKMGIFQHFLTMIGWNTEYGDVQTDRLDLQKIFEFSRLHNVLSRDERLWQYYPKSLDRIADEKLIVRCWFYLLSILDALTPKNIRHSATIFLKKDTKSKK